MPRRSIHVLVGILSAALLTTTACTSDAGGGGDEQPDAERRPTASERLDLRTGWGPTRAELEQAARRVDRMPVGRLAGQVIVAEWSGPRAPLRMVRRLHLGGVIAFSDNIVSAQQVRRANRELQRGVRRPWPLMVAVDQEGGRVVRVDDGVTRFPSFMSVGAADDQRLTRDVHRASGGELRRLGFNVDFAPVADVTVGPVDTTIGARAAGSDPRKVTEHALAAARGLLAGGVVPVLKHFPGHGSVGADSHVRLPVQTRGRERLEANDWRPFRAAVEEGLPAIMMGHIDVRAIHRGVPSSLSPRLIRGALRRDLGFEGLVVTDALNMGAVTRSYGPGDAAVRALRAGADVLLMPTDPAVARRGIVRAVRSDRLPKQRLRQAAARQIALLLHHEATARRGRPPGSSWAVSERLSATALTSVAGDCSGQSMPDRPVPIGEPLAVANFRLAAQNAGVQLGEIDYVKPPPPLAPPPPGAKAPKKRQADHRKRLQQHRRDLARWRRIAPRPVLRGTRIDLVGAGRSTPPGSYVVAVDTPYVLGRSAAPVRIATFGDTLGAMTALVRFLQGEASAPGRLPVPVRGVRRGC
jgi:beta-N-acetylhexosaminidase